MEFDKAEFVDRNFEKDGKESRPDSRQESRGSRRGSGVNVPALAEGALAPAEEAPAAAAAAEEASADVTDDGIKDDVASSLGNSTPACSDLGSRPNSAGDQAGMGRRRPKSGSAGRKRRRNAGSPPRSEGGLSSRSEGERSQSSAQMSNAARRASCTARRASMGRRASRVSAMRISSQLRESLMGGALLGKPAPVAGLMLDFIERLAKDEGKDGLFAGAAHDAAAEKFLRDTVDREELVSEFMDIIINYNKSTENLGPKEKPWPKTYPAAMRNQMKLIIDIKKQAKCLFAEVHNWLLKYRLFHSYNQDRFETIDERRNRMEEFWSHYHTRCRRNELPPIAVEAVLPSERAPTAESRPSSPSNALLSDTRKSLIMERKKTSPLLLSEEAEEKVMRPSTAVRMMAKSKRSTIGARSAEDQWAMIDSIEAKEEDYRSRRRKTTMMMKSSSSPDIDTRKYSMRWNADTMSMQWSTTDPAPGSRAAKAENLYMQREKQLGGASQTGFGAALAQRSKKKGDKKGGLPELETSGKMGLTGSLLLQQQTALATDKYLEACQRCWIVPMPLPFVTGHSFRLSAKGRDMTDADLRAVTVMIHDSFSLAECDLGANAKLTDKALVPFIHRLFGEPGSTTLQRFVLSDCKSVGLGTVNMTIRLLEDFEGARNLRSLELSRVRITPKSHLELAKAVHKHSCLEELHLQDTQLGATIMAKQCLTEIFESKSLRHLDLSWNCFDPDEFTHLGVQLVEYDRIRTLKLANCSSAVCGLSNPITYFLEQLSHDEGLTNLDISINRMDFRAALLIEDSFQNHKQIKELNLSDNPMGVQGMRSCLRLLSRLTCGLQHFECRNCFTGHVFNEDPKTPAQVFNMSNPGGRYTLDLEKPYHRSLLRMLYKTTESFGVSHEETFKDIKYSKGKYAHPVKDSDDIWMVPEVGKLGVTYNIEKALEARLSDVKDDAFSDFLEKHAEIMNGHQASPRPYRYLLRLS